MNMLDLIEDMTGPMEVPFSQPNFYELEGRCEDDKSVLAPYIGILPEETSHEEPSPLDFGTYGQRSAGSLFEQWLRQGW
jgi:hypothetical protein